MPPGRAHALSDKVLGTRASASQGSVSTAPQSFGLQHGAHRGGGVTGCRGTLDKIKQVMDHDNAFYETTALRSWVSFGKRPSSGRRFSMSRFKCSRAVSTSAFLRIAGESHGLIARQGEGARVFPKKDWASSRARRSCRPWWKTFIRRDWMGPSFPGYTEKGSPPGKAPAVGHSPGVQFLPGILAVPEIVPQ